MTRHAEPGYGGMSVEEALEVLYDDSIRDLTSEGYPDALRELRGKDPKMARRVERVLGPFLERQVFPRRQREWHDTSVGRKARLALLPGNPHLATDVLIVREILSIPLGHVKVGKGDTAWQALEGLVGPERVRRVAEGNLAGAWLHVHRKATLGQPLEEGEAEVLSSEMRASAVRGAGADLQSTQVPVWMRRVQVGSASDEAVAAPLDWCALRLAGRYCLPERVAPSLGLHILTQDVDWLAGLQPLDVHTTYPNAPSEDPDAFTVSVRGIDEFVTEEDWRNVWHGYVRPRQALVWGRRGMAPQGRRTADIGRLQKYLPMYRQMVAEGLPISDFLKQIPPKDPKMDNVDLETVRRNMADLERLLSPSGCMSSELP